MIRTLAFASVAGLAALGGGGPRCTPEPPSPSPTCEETISWAGRSPVHVVRVPGGPGQNHLDRGRAVNIGVDEYHHVAGHYSSHGSIFRSGPSLDVGENINYDCENFTVVGRGAHYPGAEIDLRLGLTVQYSGCGGVCLVYADKA